MSSTTHDSDGANLIKVLFYPNDDHYTTSETLWAEPLGNDTYRLRNTPFYFYGVSLEDVVRALPAADGMLEFVEIVERAGWSAFRVMVREGVDQSRCEEFWGPLRALGCSFEQARGGFYAINVPPTTDVDHAVTLLARGEENNVWDWEEGYRHRDAKVSLTRSSRRSTSPS